MNLILGLLLVVGIVFLGVSIPFWVINLLISRDKHYRNGKLEMAGGLVQGSFGAVTYERKENGYGRLEEEVEQRAFFFGSTTYTFVDGCLVKVWRLGVFISETFDSAETLAGYAMYAEGLLGDTRQRFAKQFGFDQADLAATI